MELAQPEALGVFDKHYHGVRHVDADLDDRSRDQQLYLPGGKTPHDAVLFRRLHTAVKHPDCISGELALAQLLRIFHRRNKPLSVLFPVALDQRTDDVALISLVKLPAHESVGALPLAGIDGVGPDRHPSHRQLVDHRDLEVAVDRARKRTRYRRRRHRQHMRRPGLAGQRKPLTHSKPVLLVGDDKPQPRKIHILFDDRVRSDQHIGFAGCGSSLYLRLVLRRYGARQQFDAYSERPEQL